MDSNLMHLIIKLNQNNKRQYRLTEKSYNSHDGRYQSYSLWMRITKEKELWDSKLAESVNADTMNKILTMLIKLRELELQR